MGHPLCCEGWKRRNFQVEESWATRPASETPITPIIVGEGRLAMEFSRELFNEGVFAPGIAFPTVAEGKARLRTIMTATHTRDQLTRALEVIQKVGKRTGVIA